MLLLHTSLDAPWLCKTAEANNLSLMSVLSKHKSEIGEKKSRGLFRKHRKSILIMIS